MTGTHPDLATKLSAVVLDDKQSGDEQTEIYWKIIEEHQTEQDRAIPDEIRQIVRDIIMQRVRIYRAQVAKISLNYSEELRKRALDVHQSMLSIDIIDIDKDISNFLNTKTK